MKWAFYLRSGVAFIPTTAKTQAGFYIDVEPVEVVPVTERTSLERALLRTIQRGNPIVPTPARATFPAPVVLAHAKMRSWAAFEKSASGWSIAKVEGAFTIAPYRAGKHGGWKEDLESKEAIPDDVALRDIVARVLDRAIAKTTQQA